MQTTEPIGKNETKTNPNTDNKGKLFVTFFARRRVQKMRHPAFGRAHNLPLLPGRYVRFKKTSTG